jgi:hypothetical protein
MDTTKWTSVAIRKEKHAILKAICGKKYRAPAAMIEKFIDDYCDYQSKKQKLNKEEYVKGLLNGKYEN